MFLVVVFRHRICVGVAHACSPKPHQTLIEEGIVDIPQQMARMRNMKGYQYIVEERPGHIKTAREAYEEILERQLKAKKDKKRKRKDQQPKSKEEAAVAEPDKVRRTTK